MPDLPRSVLLEAGLVLTRETAREGELNRYFRPVKWYPRIYAQKAHSQAFMRHRVYLRDRCVCANCGLDTRELHDLLARIQWALEKNKLGFDFHFRDFQRAVGLERCWRFPKALWDAHMIVPKSEGGNDEDLDNFLTLCLACHRRETNRGIYGHR